MVGDTLTFWEQFGHIFITNPHWYYYKLWFKLQARLQLGFFRYLLIPYSFWVFPDYAEEKTDTKAVNSLRPTLPI